MLDRLRRARDDEGSVAVITAVTIPVVLLVIALAMATLVWAASETETQRAADQAAVEAAASALLADFPYSQVTTLDKSLYPTAAAGRRPRHRHRGGAQDAGGRDPGEAAATRS